MYVVVLRIMVRGVIDKKQTANHSTVVGGKFMHILYLVIFPKLMLDSLTFPW